MSTEAIAEKELASELKAIRTDLEFIKEHMVDADTILSAEDKRLLDESLEHEKKGKLNSLEEIEHARNSVR